MWYPNKIKYQYLQQILTSDNIFIYSKQLWPLHNQHHHRQPNHHRLCPTFVPRVRQKHWRVHPEHWRSRTPCMEGWQTPCATSNQWAHSIVNWMSAIMLTPGEPTKSVKYCLDMVKIIKPYLVYLQYLDIFINNEYYFFIIGTIESTLSFIDK